MKQQARPSILVIGDGGAPTGYSRVLRSILEPLATRYSLHQLATRYDGDPHDYPWPLFRAARDGDVYGFNRVAPLIDELRPDIVLLLYDISFQGRYVQAIREAKARPKVVIYSPVEAPPIDRALLEPLEDVDAYVVFTDFARRVLARGLRDVREARPDFRFPSIGVIPHGIDAETFHPLRTEGSAQDLTPQNVARRKLQFDGGSDAFIVFNGNKNIAKKRLDITVEAFARFAKDKPANVMLYLHSAAEGEGWNVLLLARRNGIAERLLLTTTGDEHPNLSSSDLNLVYNACDVGINTSANEGWGLVSFEHAATGHAQIVPGHTGLTEIWAEAAELLEPTMKYTNFLDYTETYLLSPDRVAAALERLYTDPARRRELAAAGYRLATRPEFRWTNIAERWNEMFTELLGG